MRAVREPSYMFQLSLCSYIYHDEILVSTAFSLLAV